MNKVFIYIPTGLKRLKKEGVNQLGFKRVEVDSDVKEYIDYLQDSTQIKTRVLKIIEDNKELC